MREYQWLTRGKMMFPSQATVQNFIRRTFDLKVKKAAHIEPLSFGKGDLGCDPFGQKFRNFRS